MRENKLDNSELVISAASSMETNYYKFEAFYNSFFNSFFSSFRRSENNTIQIQGEDNPRETED